MLEGNSGSHPVQPPTQRRANYSRLLSAASNQVLNISRDKPSGQPGPVLSHPRNNKSLLYSNRFSLISVSAHCLPSCHWAHREEPGFIFFTHLPIRPLHTLIRSPWASLLHLNTPSSLSFSLYVRCSKTFDPFHDALLDTLHSLGVRQTALDTTLLLCLTRAEQRGAHKWACNFN